MPDQPNIALELTDGSRIAVIGGGPSGSFFSYFALEFTNRYDLDIAIDIYEAKNFLKIGAGGCNHCGGIVSESLVQKLATDGIVIPSKIIQRGLNTYTLHTEQGATTIHTPTHEKRIASVFRGCGPKGCTDTSQRSFDHYLLDLCKKKGANIILEKITEITRSEDSILIGSKKGNKKKYDLIVGAAGLDRKTLENFQSVCPEFMPPKVSRTYISEFQLEAKIIDTYFRNSMHVFLLNIPNITFGALIPKENYVTLVLLGKDIDKDIVAKFMENEQVKSCFPKGMQLTPVTPCKCYPYINIKAAKNPFADRVVLIGDAATSKLYKNGIGAAYITGRAAAKTAVFEGISKKSFKKSYDLVCKKMNTDNQVGKFVFFMTRIIQKSNILKKGLLHKIVQEQKKEANKQWMSDALWDTFTGSAGYKNIMLRFLNPKLLCYFLWSIIVSNLSPKNISYYEK